MHYLRNSGKLELRVPSTSFMPMLLKSWMPGTRPGMTLENYDVVSRLSPRPDNTCPTCRQSPACGWPPPRPASATRTAPTCCWRCSTTGTTVAGVFTRSKCPSAPVEWCRANLKARQSRARWWSIPAMPMPSPARTAAPRRKFTADDRRASRRLQARRNFPRLDRRHRRAARRHKLRRRDGRAWCATRAPATWLAAAKAIMTTDTFPKVATATREDRQGRRSPSTASPRAPA